MTRKTIEYGDTSDRRRWHAKTRRPEWFHAAGRGIEDAVADEKVGAPERKCPFVSSTYLYAWRGAYTTYRATGEDIRRRYKLKVRDDEHGTKGDGWKDVRVRLLQARRDWQEQAQGRVFAGHVDGGAPCYKPDPTLTEEDYAHARMRVRDIDLELARKGITRKKL